MQNLSFLFLISRGVFFQYYREANLLEFASSSSPLFRPLLYCILLKKERYMVRSRMMLKDP